MTSFDTGALRKTFGTFVTGVTVVTTMEGRSTPRGFTANSFTSVSLDPPLVLVCLSRKASSFQAFMEGESFCVNILSQGQRKIASVFASKSDDKFAGIEWRSGKTGSPVLAQVSAWMDCGANQRIEAGDHVILMGEVVEFATASATPLGYFSGGFVDFDLQRQAVDAATHEELHVGAILDHGDRILMLRDGDKLVLPSGRSLGFDAPEAGSLAERLHSVGADARLGIVYAVSEEREKSILHVYYRGELTRVPAASDKRVALVPLSDIPWDRLASEQNAFMLRRYVQERSASRFGIYVGDMKGGVVHHSPRLS